MIRKINDFGERLDGAFKFYFVKDLAEFLERIRDMTDAEKQAYIVKTAVWPDCLCQQPKTGLSVQNSFLTDCQPEIRNAFIAAV